MPLGGFSAAERGGAGTALQHQQQQRHTVDGEVGGAPCSSSVVARAMGVSRSSSSSPGAGGWNAKAGRKNGKPGMKSRDPDPAGAVTAGSGPGTEGRHYKAKGGALYSQYLDLLGQYRGASGASSSSAGRGPKKGQGEGEIIPTATAKTKAKANNKGGPGRQGKRSGQRLQHQQQEQGQGRRPGLVEAQRQFFRACITQKRLDLALKYVEALDETRRDKREMVYSSLLSSCVRLNAFDSARAVHGRQVELGLGSNAFAYSMLISLAGKMRSKAGLRKKWQAGQSQQRTPSGHGGGGEGAGASYIHTYLGEAGAGALAAVDESDLLLEYVRHYFESSVREACCNVVVCNAALDAYGRNGCLEEVFRLHERMRSELGIEENAETFNILMQTATRTGNHSLVFSLRAQMREMGVQPTERTFSILLSSVGKLQRRDLREMFSEMLASGDPEAAGELQSGVTEWAFGLLDEMGSRGIGLNNHILSALFSACAIEGKGMKRCRALLFKYGSVAFPLFSPPPSLPPFSLFRRKKLLHHGNHERWAQVTGNSRLTHSPFSCY